MKRALFHQIINCVPGPHRQHASADAQCSCAHWIIAQVCCSFIWFIRRIDNYANLCSNTEAVKKLKFCWLACCPEDLPACFIFSFFQLFLRYNGVSLDDYFPMHQIFSGFACFSPLLLNLWKKLNQHRSSVDLFFVKMLQCCKQELSNAHQQQQSGVKCGRMGKYSYRSLSIS